MIALARGLQPALVPAFGARLEDQAPTPAPVELVLGPPAVALEGRLVGPDGSACKVWHVAVSEGTPTDGDSGRTLEALIAGDDDAARTDRDGRFRIEGLLEREYVLRAWNRRERRLVLEHTEDRKNVNPCCGSAASLLRGSVRVRRGNHSLPL